MTTVDLMYAGYWIHFGLICATLVVWVKLNPFTNKGNNHD